jgi:hypothetical protein
MDVQFMQKSRSPVQSFRARTQRFLLALRQLHKIAI